MNRLIAEEEEDRFDHLPNDVVLAIFHNVRDAKSLCLSMCACRRFRRIASQVGEISYDITHREKPPPPPPAHQKAATLLKSLLAKTLIKPFHLLLSPAAKAKHRPKAGDGEDLEFYSSHVPNRVLKPFADVRSVSLRLPCHGGSKGPTSNFLKWRADFGRELRSCAILGAKSWEYSKEIEKEPSQGTTAMSEDELKLRIVWTISCLIAASARHYLVQETLRCCKSIEKIVVCDEIEQGIMSMDREGIWEMKEDSASSSPSGYGHRSKVPALKMKMWYLDRVEVSGKMFEGATLVVIRPAADVDGDSKKIRFEDLVMGAFGEDLVLGEAAGKLMVAAKRCYSLEMNSF